MLDSAAASRTFGAMCPSAFCADRAMCHRAFKFVIAPSGCAPACGKARVLVTARSSSPTSGGHPSMFDEPVSTGTFNYGRHVPLGVGPGDR